MTIKWFKHSVLKIAEPRNYKLCHVEWFQSQIILFYRVTTCVISIHIPDDYYRLGLHCSMYQDSFGVKVQ